jgi:segregation and condensation protein A
VVEDAMWSNPQIARFREEETDPRLAVTLFDLVKTFQSVLDRAKNRPVYEVDAEDVTVPDMIRYLRLTFENERDSVSARELFEKQRSRRAMICLFLAMLELVKLQAVGLVQHDAFGEIGLKRLPGFAAAFEGADAVPAMNEDYR